jgi:hypothetical protein
LLTIRGGAVNAATKTASGVLVAMLLVVLLSAGPALAALPLIVGTNVAERITGTKNAEEIRGLGGPDEISAGLRKDLVYGGRGADDLIGTSGTARWIASTGGVATTSSSPETFPRSRTWWVLRRWR